MDIVMTLLVPAKLLCNLWSFLWHSFIHWITATSYDKIWIRTFYSSYKALLSPHAAHDFYWRNKKTILFGAFSTDMQALLWQDVQHRKRPLMPYVNRVGPDEHARLCSLIWHSLFVNINYNPADQNRYLCKQCRSRWDGSWRAISSGSTLFAIQFLYIYILDRTPYLHQWTCPNPL